MPGVAHQGNGRFSDEESDRIVREVGLLLQGTVVLGAGHRRPLQHRDILVVAPYNLQRRRLGERLYSAGYGGVAVGTVDKFQRQEAPVVFYPMATSSDEDLPRDMNFFFDKNRFNVAVPRAQCLSVLVCSPRLLDARCKRPEQMELGLISLGRRSFIALSRTRRFVGVSDRGVRVAGGRLPSSWRSARRRRPGRWLSCTARCRPLERRAKNCRRCS